LFASNNSGGANKTNRTSASAKEKRPAPRDRPTRSAARGRITRTAASLGNPELETNSSSATSRRYLKTVTSELGKL